jgi:hypothetical protein
MDEFLFDGTVDLLQRLVQLRERLAKTVRGSREHARLLEELRALAAESRALFGPSNNAPDSN